MSLNEKSFLGIIDELRHEFEISGESSTSENILMTDAKDSIEDANDDCEDFPVIENVLSLQPKFMASQNQDTFHDSVQVTAPATDDNSNTENPALAVESNSGAKSSERNESSSENSRASLFIQARNSHHQSSTTHKKGATLDAHVKSWLTLSPESFITSLMNHKLVFLKQFNQTKKAALKLCQLKECKNTWKPIPAGYIWLEDSKIKNDLDHGLTIVHRSFFEPYPTASHSSPDIILKLIYHWAAFSNINNVATWVGVSLDIIHHYYTLLRAVCVWFVQNHLFAMTAPNPSKPFNLGLISLGVKCPGEATGSSSGDKKICAEVMGLRDLHSHRMRFYATKPPPSQMDARSHGRFYRVLAPIKMWLRPDSHIQIDKTVNEQSLKRMGYICCVVDENSDEEEIDTTCDIPLEKDTQNTDTLESSGIGCPIVKYMGENLPRIFHKYLQVLELNEIQMTLDELSFRECFGSNPIDAYSTLISALKCLTADCQMMDVRVHEFLRLITLKPHNDWRRSNYTQTYGPLRHLWGNKKFSPWSQTPPPCNPLDENNEASEESDFLPMPHLNESVDVMVTTSDSYSDSITTNDNIEVREEELVIDDISAPTLALAEEEESDVVVNNLVGTPPHVAALNMANGFSTHESRLSDSVMVKQEVGVPPDKSTSERRQKASDQIRNSTPMRKVINSLLKKVKYKPPEGGKIEKEVDDVEDLETNGPLVVKFGRKDVILEEYFYARTSDFDEPPPNEFKSDMAFRCHECEKVYMNNIEFMRHLNFHVEVEEGIALVDINDMCQCKYCFKHFDTPNILQTHIQCDHLHVSDDLINICRICDKIFQDRWKFFKHMSDSHFECEMPYVCPVCNFRCSLPHDMFDHFSTVHDRTDKLLCHKCLKVFSLFSEKGVYHHNLSQIYISHLEDHADQNKFARYSKLLISELGCANCSLSFLSERCLKDHLYKDHSSSYNTPLNNIKSYTHLTTKTSFPEPVRRRSVRSSKTNRGRPQSFSTVSPIIRLSSNSASSTTLQPAFAALNLEDVAYYNMPGHNASCIECDRDMTKKWHYSALLGCTRCQYSTCCEKSLYRHINKFHGNPPSYDMGRVHILPEPMFCTCGFNSTSGNKLAKHLATTNHSVTVYSKKHPSDEHTTHNSNNISQVESQKDRLDSLPPSLSPEEDVNDPLLVNNRMNGTVLENKHSNLSSEDISTKIRELEKIIQHDHEKMDDDENDEYHPNRTKKRRTNSKRLRSFNRKK